MTKRELADDESITGSVQATPASSVIASVAYDVATGTLEVVFRSGRVYRYFDVPPEAFDALRQADSVGAFFNHEIKPRYRSREIVRDK